MKILDTNNYKFGDAANVAAAKLNVTMFELQALNLEHIDELLYDVTLAAFILERW